MKKNIRFIILAPLFMAILCESDDTIPCGFVQPENYVINVGNIAETYAVGETFFLSSEVSSEVENTCNTNNAAEILTDRAAFRQAVFILKLNITPSEINAEVTQDYEVTYDVGEDFDSEFCSEPLIYVPELSDDNLTYSYRYSISMNTPGDYCIVDAGTNAFNLEQENNAQIFEPYNTLNNRIRFIACGDVFTRFGTDGHYFFTVE